MKKLILNTAVVICAFLYVLTTAGSAQEKNRIDYESIQYVEMTQNGKQGKGIRLSDNQVRELSKQWNQARPVGLCKFYAKYIISVHVKNGETRVFRATENTMKEENDYCFILEDNYIATLWKSNQ